jgi:diaminopimelate epimerase
VSDSPAYFLSGAGNDFLALVEPPCAPETAEIRAWCSRGLSIGADGVFILDRTPGGARMRYWNADGGAGDLCLNGSRCAAQLAFQLGWGQEDHLTLKTPAGALVATRQTTTRVSLALPAIIGRAEALTFDVNDSSFAGWSIAVGVPHLVVPWPASLGQVPIETLGPALRTHPRLGAAGANVDFVRFRSATEIDLRTYERGVEGETLACGTGAVAAAAIGVAKRQLALPVTVRTAGGFDLEVDGEVRDNRLVEATLAGDARVVASCRLFDAALQIPAPTAW